MASQPTSADVNLRQCRACHVAESEAVQVRRLGIVYEPPARLHQLRETQFVGFFMSSGNA